VVFLAAAAGLKRRRKFLICGNDTRALPKSCGIVGQDDVLSHRVKARTLPTMVVETVAFAHLHSFIDLDARPPPMR